MSTCVNDSDTAWMLISSVMVLGMTPGLAYFESGLLRGKNTLSIVMQCFCGLVVLGVMWNLFGFSFVFGKTMGGVLGNPWTYLGMRNVDFQKCLAIAPSVSIASFSIFQMMFAAITPLLITGAYAERVRFKASLVFTILFEILVYYPVAHWIWGDGGWLGKMGVVDFAGGITIHTTAGTAACVISWYIGKREDFKNHHGEPHPHDITLACIGAASLYLGWFFFNAGSAMSVGSVGAILATHAVVNTQAAATTAGVTALFLSWIPKKKPSTVAVINGLIAGLAGVTPASGYIEPQAAMLLGAILGASSWLGVHFFKGFLKIDDALDVTSVHGLPGIIGAIYIGFFATGNIDPTSTLKGVVHGGNGKLLGVQVLAVVVAAAWSGFWTIILCVVLDRVLPPRGRGLRVRLSKEAEGLDYHEHHESAKQPLLNYGSHDEHVHDSTGRKSERTHTPRRDRPATDVVYPSGPMVQASEGEQHRYIRPPSPKFGRPSPSVINP